jgi:hypothetical protein
VFDARTQGRILIVSGDPDVREGWARYFEARGLGVVRCAGPEATHCALERGAHCPLLDEADAAYYHDACMTDELAVGLMKRPRLLPVFIAHDKVGSSGVHVPEVRRAI